MSADSTQLVDSIPRPSPELLALHVAEYNALTTRGTYVIVVQASLWPMMIIALTLLAQLNGYASSFALGWGAVAIVCAVTFISYALLLEQYRMIAYLETELRSLVSKSVPGASFWEYEYWLARRRGLSWVWWEWGTLLIPSVTVVLTTIGRLTQWSHHDWWSLGASVLAVLVTIRLATAAGKMRRDFARAS